MKLLLIHQAFVTTGEAGGTRHIEFAKRLAEAGHHITIITSPVSYLTGENCRPGHYLWQKETFSKGIDLCYCYTSGGMHKGFIPRLFAFFSFMFSSFLCALSVKDIDLVWGTSPNIFQGWTAWLTARCKRKPFLLEIRDLWPEFAVAMGALKNPLLIRLSLGLEKFLYRHADKIIVNSPGFISHIERISGRTPLLVPNGSDAAMFDPDDDGAEFRQRYGLEKAFIVMYSGAHGPANDLETVLDAAELLREEPEIRFVFVGSGKDKPRLEALREERKLDNVLFTPPVSKDEIASVMAASNAGLAILKKLDMFKTTYPNKIFDIMAAGRPVICQIDGVSREVIEKAEAGIYIEPGDPRALAAAVLRLSRDPESCQRMGANGRQAVLTTYSRDAAADELIRIMGELLSHQ